MITLTLSSDERGCRKLHPSTLEAAKWAIDHDGYVVLKDVINPSLLEALYLQMLRDLDRWPEKHGGKPFVGGNLFPSRDPSLLFDDVLHNPFIADVLSYVLGPEPSCGMYSSNVTMPGLGDQKLHVDMKALAEGEWQDRRCNEVVVNIPVIDFTLQNGATEIWAGSQHIPRKVGEFWVNEELQAEMRPRCRVERAECPRGSAIIRDIRIWHRGVHNFTSQVRPMLTMICMGGFKPGVDSPDKIPCMGTFPESARSRFEGRPRIYFNPRYQPGMPDYLAEEKHK
jgi:ectoine hydroxylase-related dioxygenase (phytanoyl-CoA dioxygenase family)